MDAPGYLAAASQRIRHGLVEHRALAIVMIVFSALVLSRFAWGLPHAISAETLSTWPVDTIAPVRPLTEAFHLFTRDGTDPVVYPLLHFVVLDVFYAPYVAMQFLLGGFNDPSAEFPYGTVDPQTFFQHLTIIARLVSLLMALGVIWAVYRITDEVATRRAAIATALFAALLAPLTYYAGTSNLEAPYLFWSTLAVLQFVLAYRQARLRYFVGFAICAGFAVATKDQAYGFFLALPFVLLYRTRTVDKRLVAMVVAGALAFALGNNLLFGGLDGFLRHLEFSSTIHEENFKVAFPDMYTFGHQLMLAGRTGLFAAGMLGIGTLALVLGGIVLAGRARNYLALSLLLLVVTYYVFVIMYAGVVVPRYVLGPALFLLPFAGIAADRLWAALERRRLLLTAGTVFVLGWPLLLCVNLGLTLAFDSRYAIADWVRGNIEPGERIETQVQLRYLPHLSDQYRIDVVGNALDVISYDVVAAELSAEALEQRSPPYILVLEGLGVTGDPARMEGSAVVYFDALLDGKLGYKVLARFETPSFLAYRQVTAGTRPTAYLLGRAP